MSAIKKIALAGRPARTYGIDRNLVSSGVVLLLFSLLIVYNYHGLLRRLYAPFFMHESTLGLMQFTYYMKALRSGGTPFWDTYVSLAQAHVPVSPLFSPVTLILVSAAWLFNISNVEVLSSLFAFANYTIYVLTGFFMYLFLRSLSLGVPASIIGGIGYSYNSFTKFFGMIQGYFHTTPLMLAPLVFVFFLRIFKNRENMLKNIVISGAVLGVCIASNGDIKPAVYFIPILIFVAYSEGYSIYGAVRTSLIVAGVLAIAAAIASPQIYPTYETIQEASTSNFPVLPEYPLNPANSVLGFSQNAFSSTMGFLFPTSYFNAYSTNPVLGVAGIHFWEMRFNFGFPLLFLAAIGLFYKTRLHAAWFTTLVVFGLYILGSNTVLWPFWGELSRIASLRYPTRSGIVIYFILSIYAAYGVEVLSGRTASVFFDRWFKPFMILCAALLAILLLGTGLVWVQDKFDVFQPLAQAGSYALLVAGFFLVLMVVTLTIVLFGGDKSSGLLKIILPPLLFLFSVMIVIFIFSGVFVYFDMLGNDTSFRMWREELAKTSLELMPVFRLGEMAIYREFFNIITALSLGIGLLLLAHRLRDRSFFGVILAVFLALMVVVYFEDADIQRELPDSLVRDPSVVFNKDAELAPVYADPQLGAYRIFMPNIAGLAPELGFKKSINNYCCRQYLDELRFAFGMIHGPAAYEAIKRYVGNNYNHPFWNLYNVKYVVDDFDMNPMLLPRDTSTYQRISDKVIKFTGMRPVIYFMENYKVADRRGFIDEEVASRNDAMLSHVFLHDDPGVSAQAENTATANVVITIEEWASGKIRAVVDTNKTGFVVFSEIWAPSWRVSVNGDEKRCLKAYGMLQAVHVTPGRNEILFEFDIFASWKMKAAVVAFFIVVAAVIAVLAGIYPKKFRINTHE